MSDADQPGGSGAAGRPGAPDGRRRPDGADPAARATGGTGAEDATGGAATDGGANDLADGFGGTGAEDATGGAATDAATTPEGLRRIPVRVAVAIVSACVLLVVVLAFVVVGRNAVTRFDADTVADVAGGRSAGLIDVARAITLLGNGAVIAGLLVVAAVALVARGRLTRLAALLPFASLALGVALTPLLKTIVDRPRPPLRLHEVTERTSGFPSGHSAQSASGWLALGLVLWASGRGWRPLGLATATVLAVGVSRIVLGVHSPTDVLAGWAVGLACAVTVTAVAAAMRRRPDAGRAGGR